MKHPPPPSCFAMASMYASDSEVCRSCAYFLPCGAELTPPQAEVNLAERKAFVQEMAHRGVQAEVAIAAIVRRFGTSRNSASLQYHRALKKWRKK